MTTYFTSDTHYFHKNILNFEDRPYQSVEEMTNSMIDNWNKQVKDHDIVYHLGDLCLSNLENTIHVLERLNGNIVLIQGNHDHSNYYRKINQLGLLYAYYEVGITMKYEKHQMWLTHYPMDIGLRPRKWSIHGHIHSNESTWDNQINVGVDSPHFKHKPFGELITIEELYDEMMRRLPIIEENYLNQKN